MENKELRPIAVIECCEEIPCNPCMSACPHHAIVIEGGIHHIPQLKPELCVGCGICVARCSGQAIFVVGQEQDYGVVSFPYEMLPLPEKGMIVDGTDREGQTVCQGEILKVMAAKNFDHTTVVTLKVPLGKEDTVRGFRFREDR